MSHFDQILGVPEEIRDAMHTLLNDPSHVVGRVVTEGEGNIIVSESTTLNFVGGGVMVTDAGDGVTQVSIPNGGGGNDLADTLLLGSTTGGTDIILTPGDSFITPAGSGAAGGAFVATTGAGDGAFAGGDFIFNTGTAGATARGGDFTVNGAAGGATSGTGGSVFLLAGDGDGNGASGDTVDWHCTMQYMGT